MTTLLISLMLVGQMPAAVPARTAQGVKVAKTEAAQIDLATLQGKVRQLAWSPEGNELYLQTFDTNPDQTPKSYFHYRLTLPDGVVTPLTAAPAWAAAYLTWKSDKSAPGDPSMTIELAEGRKRMDTTGTSTAGAMATGGSDGTANGTSIEAAVAAANQSQMVRVITLRLKGETIGEFLNSPLIPGLTFGWGPPGSGLIVFTDASGRVTIMDAKGGKTRVPDTKGGIVPAWSQDGTKLAWLESRGKNRYAVIVGNVTW
jgi:hypothetical protein